MLSNENYFSETMIILDVKKFTPLAHNPFQRPNKNRYYWDFSKQNSNSGELICILITRYLSPVIYLYFSVIILKFGLTTCVIFQDKTIFLWLS